MRIIAVLHSDKVTGLQGYPPELGANPPMTMTGMQNIHQLVPTIKSFGPYCAAFCSRLARATDAMSVLSMALDLEFQSMRELGQSSNKDGEGVIAYPGHGHENYVFWQNEGMRAFGKIWGQVQVSRPSGELVLDRINLSVLVVSHRPIIGGIVAHTMGLRQNDEIGRLIQSPAFTEKSYVRFSVSNAGFVSVLP